MYYPQKKQKFSYTFHNAVITSIKPLQQRDENFIFIKCRSANNFMYDLNNAIVDTVKKNSLEWFNNNMNLELIDDYFTSTLVYEKGHGDVIRLKCIGDDDKLKTYIDKPSDITVVFDQIRFYKQKFVLECSITDVTEEPALQFADLEDDIVHDTEYEESPHPTPDDVKAMREEFMCTTQAYLEELEQKHEAIATKIIGAREVLKELEEAKDVDAIISICDKIEKLAPQ